MTTNITPDGSVSSRLDQRRRSANEVSNESYTAKQREIIEAAVRLFADKGYSATNLDDIANALKMDRATLYYYFKSKTQLLGSAMVDALSDSAREMNKIVASDDDALSKLRAAVRCILSTMAEKHPVSALYFQDDIWRSPRNAAWIAPLRRDDARITKAFQKIIDEGQRDGTIRADVSADLVNRMVFGSVGWTYRWFKPDGAHSVDEVVHAFDTILSAGLAPPKAPTKRTAQGKPTSSARRTPRSKTQDSATAKSARRR
jgi:TetR/AcrR family transcriptional regulator, cholesterol catabolism regulator